MIKITKNLKAILPTLALGLILGGGAVLGIKYASAGFSGGQMAQDLAKKLNVSEDQVSTAMDEIRSEKQTEMKEEQSANLDKAVSDGVITAEQKQSILSEQAKMEQQQKDHQSWRENSGIDWEKLKDYHVGIGMMGMMGKGGRGPCCD